MGRYSANVTAAQQIKMWNVGWHIDAVPIIGAMGVPAHVFHENEIYLGLFETGRTAFVLVTQLLVEPTDKAIQVVLGLSR